MQRSQGSSKIRIPPVPSYSLSMLARYHMRRGRSPEVEGIRQDTRKHTRHCLRPTAEMVTDYLAEVSTAAWREFQQQYLALLRMRFSQDRRPFDKLAELAGRNDVYIGCSCPTARNPHVMHCHTALALRFMRKQYPELIVLMPSKSVTPN
jgi:hypothetical protein